jgi:hypothetical protein
MNTPREAKKNAATAAKQLLAHRIAPVEELAAANAELDSARKAVRDAETTYAHRYQHARDAGWSTKELANIGLRAPTGRKRQPHSPTQPTHPAIPT